MNYSKKDLIIFAIFHIIILSSFFFKKEAFATGGTENSDMEAIRNLSKLANDLTKNGKLVVPGGLEIKGRLTVNGETKVRAKTYFYKQVAFKNQKKKVDGLILIMIMDIVVVLILLFMFGTTVILEEMLKWKVILKLTEM